jgi:hypothetical protein
VLTAGAGTSAAIVPGLGPSLSSPLAAASGLDLPPGTVPACADLDGDRRADLVLLRPGASELEVLRSTGGGFGPPERHPFAPAGLGSGAAIAAADLDRDGDVDLVVADARAGAVAVLRNLGDGRFASARTVAIGASPTALAAVDLDGDRWPDVAVADASGAVHVLANLGAAP